LNEKLETIDKEMDICGKVLENLEGFRKKNIFGKCRRLNLEDT
jgi:hypothetical protein